MPDPDPGVALGDDSPTLRAMSELQLEDLTLYYEVHGEGPRVLFVNGSGQTIEGSRLLIEVLASRCTVAVHDQRGSGQSSVPAPPYTMADYAADAAALLDHLGWDRTAVIGVSFGGMVAQELAVTWPERIERLALLCTSPGGPDTSSYPLERLAALPPQERAAEGLRILDTRFERPGWFDEHPGDLALVEQIVQRQQEQAARSADAGDDVAGAAQLDARAGHDVRDRLHLISCPTLVAAGRYDGIAPLPNARAIVAAVEGAELAEFEGGHAFIAQDPAAFPVVLDFLDPSPAPAAAG